MDCYITRNTFCGGVSVLNESGRDTCPRCGAMGLHAWRELSAEEREVVRRLPGSAELSLAERTARHRFCVRCWHEATDTEKQG